jgi:hypothetical protein
LLNGETNIIRQNTANYQALECLNLGDAGNAAVLANTLVHRDIAVQDSTNGVVSIKLNANYSSDSQDAIFDDRLYLAAYRNLSKATRPDVLNMSSIINQQIHLMKILPEVRSGDIAKRDAATLWADTNDFVTGGLKGC